MDKKYRVALTVDNLADYALFLYVFCLNFEELPVQFAGNTFSLSSLIAVAVVSLHLLTQRGLVLKTKIVTFYLPFLLIYVVATFGSPLINMSALVHFEANYSLLFDVVVSLIVAMRIADDEAKIDNALFAFTAGALLIVIAGLAGTISEIVVENDSRLRVLNFNENYLASRTFIAVVILLPTFYKYNFITLRWWCVSIFTLCALAFIANLGSLTVLLALIVWMISAVFYSRLTFKRLFVICASGVSLALILLEPKAFNWILSWPIAQRASYLMEDLASVERIFIWSNYVDVYASKPLFGHGFGGADHALRQIGEFHDAHNLILSIAVYSGTAGLFIVSLWLINISRLVFSAKAHPQKLLISGFWSILVCMSLLQPVLPLSSMWFVISILAVAFSKSSFKKLDNEICSSNR